MHGLFFTTLFDYLEQRFDLEVVDHALQSIHSESAGAYTAVASYPHAELLDFIAAVSRQTGTPGAELQREFGMRLFGELAMLHPDVLQRTSSSVDFIECVDRELHREVLRRYPGARVPSLQVRRYENGAASVEYASHRPFSEIAAGLIAGCIKHFGEAVDLKVDYPENNDHRHAVFHLVPLVRVARSA